MKFCPHCGVSLPGSAASFCPECGKALPAGKPAGVRRQKKRPPQQKPRQVPRARPNPSNPMDVSYLGWDELTAQLQEIVVTELGPGYTVTLRRQDYYYWDMRLETTLEMDEALSKKICERLELRDVDVLIFLEDDWVDSNYLCGLLSKLTHREVTSSHADDHGVWIICKSLVWSSPEFTAYLLAKCEKRLRREIKDRHYSLVNPDTACYQLFGFMEVLTLLGLLDRDKWVVMPGHFTDTGAAQKEANRDEV